MEQVTLIGETGAEEIALQILERTKLGGEEYILAADPKEEEAYILKQVGAEDEDVCYAFVEDESTLGALSKLFSELSDDYEIQSV